MKIEMKTKSKLSLHVQLFPSTAGSGAESAAARASATNDTSWFLPPK
jgi:hypothetical protein